MWAKRPGGLFLNIHTKRTNGPKYRTLLTMDAATSHRDINFKKSMAVNHDTKVEIIPAGMTPLLQPADVSWNRAVKESIREQWSEWLESPKDSSYYTKNGNLKRPSYALVAEWCVNAWNQLSTETIIKSFVYCNCGKVRDDSRLHSRLAQILANKALDQTPLEEHTQLTDDESEDEEVTDIIENLNALNVNI